MSQPPPCDLFEREAEVYGALVTRVADYVRKPGFDRVLLGLSGGVDSALVAVIAVDALGADRVTCVVMPSPHSSPATQGDARTLARNLGVDCCEISIGGLARSPGMGRVRVRQIVEVATVAGLSHGAPLLSRVEWEVRVPRSSLRSSALRSATSGSVSSPSTMLTEGLATNSLGDSSGAVPFLQEGDQPHRGGAEATHVNRIAPRRAPARHPTQRA
jgi:hypothetical protein